MPDNATPVKAEKLSVAMTDGRTQEFNKKQKLVKTSTIGDDGTVTTVLDFSNGETRSFSIRASDPLYSRFVAHGAEQKLGDAIAGETDIGDAVMAVDDLLGRLGNNDWTIQRQAGSFTGTSILLQALIEASDPAGDPAALKTWLASKSQQEKFALRRADSLKPIIDRLEAEKASKTKSSVDTNALLGELGLNADGGTAAKSKKASAEG